VISVGTRGGREERGQVIVLVALMMVIFIGVVGLVVDIGGGYATQRFFRSVADSSSLAGTQELQTASRRIPPTAAQYEKARQLSMRSLVNQLASPSAPLPTCPVGGSPPNYPADVVNCHIAGTPYYVSISAPGLTCRTIGGCDPTRSVQVTVRRPDFGLVFAKIFNQVRWNIVGTAVAEFGFAPNYTLVTLRPPKPSRANDPRCAPDCDDNEDNVLLDGNTTVLRIEGDVGTNTNIKLTAGAQIVMDASNSIYHYDAYLNWTPPPAEKQLSSPIPDPNYTIPGRTGGTTWTNDTTARITDPVLCNAERDKVPASYGVSGYSAAAGEVLCYKPGIYPFKLSASPAARVILLTPGLYFFDKGVSAGANVRFAGGYQAGSQGVALVFPSGAGGGPPSSFDVASVPLVALNAGSAVPLITSGTPATAALDYNGNPITNGGSPAVLLTLIVQKDSRCVVGLTEPPSCPNNLNQLKLNGGGRIYLTGIQYAASDGSTIVGGSTGSGYIGEFISWTVKYTGGSQVVFTHSAEEKPGIMRIAVPCSPGTACSEPYATVPIP
jgi:hypothetical protein